MTESIQSNIFHVDKKAGRALDTKNGVTNIIVILGIPLF